MADLFYVVAGYVLGVLSLTIVVLWQQLDAVMNDDDHKRTVWGRWL